MVAIVLDDLVYRFFVDGKQINTRETAARIVLVDNYGTIYFVP